ncbi:MAG: 4Fe-4S binding protein [Candidatus Methanoliparum thermophilum]|uniref:4Fe-4S binding protein n=1 Tax=Methanoliparum thermophilum TaxID=2491083 RepID=A0A520KT92_METT2|nr:MAG: 4Fe-4S binding protein [Candidatus Methanoliparum thermophilum]
MLKNIGKKIGSLRTKVQISFMILANSLFLKHLMFFPFPIMNCYSCPLAVFSCPIGTLQYFIGIGAIPFYTVGVLGSIGSLFGRFSCGWACPFGFIQDLLYKIKIPFFKKRVIPERYGIIKYIFLGIVILLPIFMAVPFFCMICPVGTLEAGIPTVLLLNLDINLFFWIKIGILIAIILTMFIFSRPFCKLFCPLGAILGLFNKISGFRLRVDDSCTKCGRCERVCPMNIKVYKSPNSPNCIRCLKCVEECNKISIERPLTNDKSNKAGDNI